MSECFPGSPRWDTSDNVVFNHPDNLKKTSCPDKISSITFTETAEMIALVEKYRQASADSTVGSSGPSLKSKIGLAMKHSPGTQHAFPKKSDLKDAAERAKERLGEIVNSVGSEK